METTTQMPIEHGPGLLRLLAFAAGAASLGAVIFLLINPNNLMHHPIMYTLYLYITVFALTTMVFEAKPEWIENMGSAINKYHDLLIKHCGFLTVMGGRGVFYFFQGTLWLTFADSWQEMIQVAAGVALAVVGFLHLLGHWGIMPAHIVEKATKGVGVVKGASPIPTA